jgi:hypothetical protein
MAKANAYQKVFDPVHDEKITAFSSKFVCALSGALLKLGSKSATLAVCQAARRYHSALILITRKPSRTRIANPNPHCEPEES